MTPYPWTCLACDHAEPPAAARCTRCGCSARATAAEVDAARAARFGREGRPPAVASRPWAGVSWWPIGATVFAALGGAMLVVAMSVASSASAAAIGGLLLSLAAFCLSSQRRAGPGGS